MDTMQFFWYLVFNSDFIVYRNKTKESQIPKDYAKPRQYGLTYEEFEDKLLQLMGNIFVKV
jgi:hypothetical protein